MIRRNGVNHQVSPLFMLQLLLSLALLHAAVGFAEAPPQPPAAWAGVHDATEFKHNCMQGSMNMGWPQPLSTQSEDCVRHRPRRPLPCRP